MSQHCGFCMNLSVISCLVAGVGEGFESVIFLV